MPEDPEEQQQEGSPLEDAAEAGKDYAGRKMRDKLGEKLGSRGAGAAGRAGATGTGEAGAGTAAGAGGAAAEAGAGTAAASGGAAAASSAGSAAAAGGTAGTAGGPLAPATVPLAAAAAVAAEETAGRAKKVIQEQIGDDDTGKQIFMGCCCCALLFLLPVFLVFFLIFGFFGLLGSPQTAEARPADENEFVELQKLVSAPSLSIAPSQIIHIENSQLPQSLKYDIKFRAITELNSIVCSDVATLRKSDGSTENIPLPPLTPCPATLTAAAEFSLTFQIMAPNDIRYRDGVVSNTFTLSGNGVTLGGGNLDYYIPFRDTSVHVVNEDSIRDSVINNPSWPNNFAKRDVYCEPGVTCWDYVKQKAFDGGVNPAFVLAVWISESGASHFSGHLSCPNGGLGLSHTIADLKLSVDCFVDLANDFTSDQFAKMLDQFCDPATPEICQEPPAPVKTFLATLKSWYSSLVPAGNPGALTITGGGVPTPFTVSSTAIVTIGTASAGCYNFVGSWTADEKTKETEAINVLASSPTFMTLACAGGSVDLSRTVDGSYYGVTNGAHGITIHGPDLGSLGLRLYILAHESGHVIGNMNPGLFSNFQSSGIYEAEGLVATYAKEIGLPGTNCSTAQIAIPYACYDESFAEMTSDYVLYTYYSFPARTWSGYPGGVWFHHPSPSWDSFNTDWDQHYNFARTNIFGGTVF